MLCDFHSHFLPGIDDGARNSEQSVEILKYLKKNGVEVVCSTSHYSCHHESVDQFLKRRAASLDRLNSYMDKNNIDRHIIPEIVLGAEVHLYNGLSEHENVEKLCLGNSNYILLEPPFEPYSSKVIEEIDNVRYQFKLKPIIAHINRYMPLYKRCDFENLFYSENLFLQINCECAESFMTFRKIKKVIKNDLPCIFGCDIHSPDKIGICGLEKMKAFLGCLPADRKADVEKTEKEILEAIIA